MSGESRFVVPVCQNLPAVGNVGELVTLAGVGLYVCTAPNTWSAVSSGTLDPTTIAAIAAAVWDALAASHVTAGTFGLKAGSLPSATAGAAGGVLIAGTNAPVTITGAGNALTLTSTSGNGWGLKATGQGTGAGMGGLGGATGPGVYGQGGATSGNGIQGLAQTSGSGFYGLAAGDGDGMTMVGSSGSPGGMGAHFIAGSFGNANGIGASGHGTGGGIAATGGDTGDGMNLIGGATSGIGLYVAASGENPGALILGHGAEAGVEARGGGWGIIGIALNDEGVGIEGDGKGDDGVGIAAYNIGGNGFGLQAAGSGTGVDIDAPVIAGTLLQNWTLANIVTNATTVVKSGAGFIHAVNINKGAVTSTITIYDNTAGSGTTIGGVVVDTLAGGMSIVLDTTFATGLTVVTAGGAAADITVSYK